MLLSIGIDTVTISDVERFLGSVNYADNTFTPEENAQSVNAHNVLDFYARRFAGKQACRKALEHFVDISRFDYKDIEILDSDAGFLYIRLSDELMEALKGKNIGDLLVSVTTEGNLATAIVMVQSL